MGEGPCVRRHRSRGAWEEGRSLDDVWLNSVLALLGEAFEGVGAEETIDGIAVSAQDGSCTVELWINEDAIHQQVLGIGQLFFCIVSKTPGFWDRASQIMVFEDFARKKDVLLLQGPEGKKSTVGIFQ